MKYQVYLVLSLGLVASLAFATNEDAPELDEVFSEDIIDPRITLEKLKAAADKLPDDSSYKKQVDTLIGLSELSDEKCDMVPLYEYSILADDYFDFANIITYCEYYKAAQFDRCRSLIETQVAEMKEDQQKAIQELKNSLVGAVAKRGSKVAPAIAIHSIFDVPEAARAEILYKFIEKESDGKLSTDFTIFQEQFNTVVKDVCSPLEPMKPIVDAYNNVLYERDLAKELVDDFVKDWITNVKVCSDLQSLGNIFSYEAFASNQNAV